MAGRVAAAVTADELDVAARLRRRVRTLIADLHALGVTDEAMRHKNLLELEALKLQTLGECMAGPGR